MMQRILLLILLLLFVPHEQAWSQFSRYIVRLKHKGGSAHTLANPSGYLSTRALDRRARYNISIDSTDLPVSTAQLNQIRAIPNLTVLNTSKWLNAVSIQTSDANAISALNALPFVQSVSGIASRMGPEPTRDKWVQPLALPTDINPVRTSSIMEVAHWRRYACTKENFCTTSAYGDKAYKSHCWMPDSTTTPP